MSGGGGTFSLPGKRGRLLNDTNGLNVGSQYLVFWTDG